MKKNGSKFKYNVYGVNYIVVCVSCLFLVSCSKDMIDIPVEKEKMENEKEVFFSVEEAKAFFENSRSNQVLSRVGESERSWHWLSPGRFIPKWDRAVVAESRRLGSANIPFLTSSKYKAKLAGDRSCVEVSQKLLVVKSKKMRQHGIYVLSLIPDSAYNSQNESNICDRFINSGNKGGFSGMAIYSKMNSQIPVTVALFKDGKTIDKVFLFDTVRGLTCQVSAMKRLLKGVRFKREEVMMLARASEGTGGTGGTGGGGSGNTEGNMGTSKPGDNEDEDEDDPDPNDDDDDWEWDDALFLGYDEEYGADIYIVEIDGEFYYLADTDFDGEPDRLIEDETIVEPDDPEDDEEIDADPKDDDIWNDKDEDDDEDENEIDNSNPDDLSFYDPENDFLLDPDRNSAFDSIFDPRNTNLTQAQLDSLEAFVQRQIDAFPFFKKLVEDLIKKGIRVKIEISATGSKGRPARYVRAENRIYFRDAGRLTNDTSLEEFIHLAQFQDVYIYSTVSAINIEFEAKVVNDLMGYEERGGTTGLLNFGMSSSDQLIYEDFIDEVLKYGFTDKALDLYHELGSRWTDPEYSQETYDSSQDPELIKQLFK